jgi:hypothetical protein
MGGHIGNAELFYIYGRYVIADATVGAYTIFMVSLGFMVNTSCFGHDL